MALLTLKDRACFIEVFPRFGDLGKSTAFKNRRITISDAGMSRWDLEKVLDPNGTTLEMSVDYPDIRTPLLIREALKVMPNLQEVVLKSCQIMPILHANPAIDATLFHRIYWERLLNSKVKSLTIDSCIPAFNFDFYQGGDVFNKCWFRSTYEQIFIGDYDLEKISIRNTLNGLGAFHLGSKLMVEFGRGFRFRYKNIAVKVENLFEEPADEDKILVIWRTTDNSSAKWRQLWACLQRSMTARDAVFPKFEVSRSSLGNPGITLTLDLDLKVFKDSISEAGLEYMVPMNALPALL